MVVAVVQKAAKIEKPKECVQPSLRPRALRPEHRYHIRTLPLTTASCLTSRTIGTTATAIVVVVAMLRLCRPGASIVLLLLLLLHLLLLLAPTP